MLTCSSGGLQMEMMKVSSTSLALKKHTYHSRKKIISDSFIVIAKDVRKRKEKKVEVNFNLIFINSLT